MKTAESLMGDVIMLDAEEMMVFFAKLGKYFKDEKDIITNMDAEKIGDLLWTAAHEVAKRSGE